MRSITKTSEDTYLLEIVDDKSAGRILRPNGETVAFLRAGLDGNWYAHDVEKGARIAGTYGETPRTSFRRWRNKELKKKRE